MKEWIIRGDSNTSAKRKVCPIPRNNIELSNIGKRAIQSLAVGEKHFERLVLYLVPLL